MRKFRYISVLLWLALMATALPVSASSSENAVKASTINVKLNFDDGMLELPEGQYVFIQNGSSYVPFRFVSYALQKNISWNGKTKEVTVSDPNLAQQTMIKEYLMNASSNSSIHSFKQKSISLTPIKVKFTYTNGVAITQAKVSFMLDGSLYVPIRFLSELVGTEITWNPKDLSITGKSQAFKNKTAEATTGSSVSKPKESEVPAEKQAGAGAGTGVSAGGGASKPSYDSILADTEAKLQNLYNQSSAALMSLAVEYYSASDSETKSKLKAKGEALMSQFSSSFESIVQAAETKLKANGYSTDIIQQYRDKFNEEIEAGKKLAKSLD
ncbi:hypothetical protein J2Z22_004456 [Paenibacillus forsythiae]|uniref:Copper amine oxidase-like N-terminal domain-containing protein n=1 Tax=Paenibacillus forsythiae TaxID=365616 RepID=A0ABU3HDG9_9BACL|nr:copper amine oxidase N-terminal domain-containing protein [Paenibacillus forsythiae]MDT3428862.1 hypothetical protein [Paenibacillus forsythiae]